MMQSVYDFLIQPYVDSTWVLISLEIIAVVFGIASVLYARKENILVFPTGIISTGIYVYLLHVWALRGDMLINAYFFTMSIYGWYMWSRPKGTKEEVEISYANMSDWLKASVVFVLAIIMVFVAYKLFGTPITIVTYIDCITTACFFVAMWFMALKKVENWLLWIIGDIISVPLYFYKELGLTGIQYFVFLILAIIGYREWKKIIELKNNH